MRQIKGSLHSKQGPLPKRKWAEWRKKGNTKAVAQLKKCGSSLKNSTHNPLDKGGTGEKWREGKKIPTELVLCLAKDDAFNQNSIQSLVSTCPVVAA